MGDGSVKILGVDFTSRPRSAKPITCAQCRFDGQTLIFQRLDRWESFSGFDNALLQPGPWVAGMDFPFGQSRKLVEGIGWPSNWSGYVQTVGEMTRGEFRRALEDYKASRSPGDRHHRRHCDRVSKSQSPQTLYGTPVGLMFYEGAPRLLAAGVHLPHVHDGDLQRIVLEAYPGAAARALIGKTPYKNDTRRKQTRAQQDARRALLTALLDGACSESYGFTLRAPMDLADDPGADELDALLCAVQAAWGWLHRHDRFGAPAGHDRLEGWICDPTLLPSA
jgi:hypothetical protein